MKVHHILLTTDLSDESLRAFGPARDLARMFGAKLTLLHIVPDLQVAASGAPLAPPLSSPGAEAALEKAEKNLRAFANEHLADLEVDVYAEVGFELASNITRFATKHDVDWIVLSSHGRSGLRRLVLGSVAEQVLRHADCPVLCIPPPRKTGKSAGG
jgi:nucleotide-binding universal stress UspA family protein